MRHLIIMRHAEAGMPPIGTRDQTGSDKERPITSRGQQDSAQQGQNLITLNIIPDLVLCSEAKRTKATFDMVHSQIEPHLSVDFSIDIKPELYNAGAGFITETIHCVADNIDVVMVVAHNPGVHELAQRLSAPLEGTAHSALALELHGGFPPATIAIFEIDSRGWFDLSHKNATLVHLIKV